MDAGWIIQLSLFGILHWVLVIILLRDLAGRGRVLGGRKWPWVLVLIFVTFVGSLLYLVCHPGIFLDEDRKDQF